MHVNRTWVTKIDPHLKTRNFLRNFWGSVITCRGPGPYFQKMNKGEATKIAKPDDEFGALLEK